MANTPNRGYPKPVDSREIAEDVTTLQQSADMIDADMASAFSQIEGKAPAGHTHPITDVQGLDTALAGKAAANHTHSLDDLSDVDGATNATVGQIPYKTPGGIAFGDPSTIMGAHAHSIDQVTGLQPALDAKLDDSQLDANITLAANSDAKVATQKATKSYIDGLFSALRNGVSAAYDTLAELAAGLATKADSAALGTAATKNVGTGAGQVVMLDGNARLPGVDGRNLTNLPLPILDYQVFTASGTWTKPAGLTGNELLLIRIWPAGGGGLYSGGSGGPCYEYMGKVSEIGATASVTIAGATAAGAGGGDSSIVLLATTLTAFGGRVGSGVSPANGPGGSGVLGRATSSTGGGGGGAVGGGTGLPGEASGFGGGGGGAANGGAGGPSVYGGGGGGAHGNSTTPGGAGGMSVYGGGGGGGGSVSGAGGAGGASIHGGAGGAGVTSGTGGAGQAPGGGGGGSGSGTGGTGARGECRIWVIKA